MVSPPLDVTAYPIGGRSVRKGTNRYQPAHVTNATGLLATAQPRPPCSSTPPRSVMRSPYKIRVLFFRFPCRIQSSVVRIVANVLGASPLGDRALPRSARSSPLCQRATITQRRAVSPHSCDDRLRAVLDTKPRKRCQAPTGRNPKDDVCLLGNTTSAFVRPST